MAAKDGAWHHFSLPGALHGYMSEEEDFATRGAAGNAVKAYLWPWAETLVPPVTLRRIPPSQGGGGYRELECIHT